MSKTDPLADLIAALQRLPGIGAKSAQRLAYHILKTPRADVDAMCDAMRSVKENITYCSICSNITSFDPCMYCISPERDARTICVVEQPENVAAIERTRGFKGHYHVLMGAISPLQGVGPDDLRIKPLLQRVGRTDIGEHERVTEVILATNPTVEGEATALYLARLLKPLGARVTRIAMGVPVGGDLDYTDEFTVSKAMEGRREV
ncbi:MAG: recombination protein RecR [Acidobacteria bacterium]|nr:MAG: recombination protein RecR [Acidobacteriota bacterium]